MTFTLGFQSGNGSLFATVVSISSLILWILSIHHLRLGNNKIGSRESTSAPLHHKQRQMSAGGAFGGNRGARPVPPEKGVFPLDHNHECDLEKKEYVSCLKSWGHKSDKCRLFSKKYLECRMAKNLMAKQDIEELGFRKDSEAECPEDVNISSIKN